MIDPDPVDHGRPDPVVDVAVDNDILIKAIRYGELDTLFPPDAETTHGFLDVARYVVPRALRRAKGRSETELTDDLERLVTSWVPLQPTDEEVAVAAELEFQAQRHGLSIDSGEAQLAAMAMADRVRRFASGDKRAIAGFEALLPEVPDLVTLAGRICCLEQVVRRAIVRDSDPPAFRASVCRDETADKTLAVCFSCRGVAPPSRALVLECLESYIRSARESALRLLDGAA